MKYLYTTLKLLVFINLLPLIGLYWFFYVLPLWGLGYIKYYSTNYSRFTIFFYVNFEKSNWYNKLWFYWNGHAGPCCVVLNLNNCAELEDEVFTSIHELRHVDQILLFNILFPVIYYGYMLLFILRNVNRRGIRKSLYEAYYTNPSEVDAREHTFKEVYGSIFKGSVTNFKRKTNENE